MMKAMRCQHDDCGDFGDIWTIGDDVFCFCEEHAADFGFCLLCGAFVGGTEDVFLTEIPGVCYECYAEVRDEVEADRDFFD